MNRSKIILLILAALLLPACSLQFFSSNNPVERQAEEPEGARVFGEASEATLTPDATLPQVEPPAEIEIVPSETPTFPAQTPLPPAALAARARRPYNYAVQVGSPAWLGNFVEPDAGCNWMGVAGQVFGQDGVPVKGLIVEVSGELNGQVIGPLVSMTGSMPALGPGGYLIKIADGVADTSNAFSIQIYDLNGVPQSRRYSFDTFASCEQNLGMINFVETQEILFSLFMPLAHSEFRPFSLSLPLIEK